MFTKYLLRNAFRPKSARHLSLLEYQSRKILIESGIEIPSFCVVDHKSGLTPFENFSASNYVVKAQIAAGGRGKGHFDNGFEGGVHLIGERPKVEEVIDKMLGYNLITKQTGSEGMPVNKIMVSEAVMDVEKEAYFSILIDPNYSQPITVASPSGGVNIENIAMENPNLVHKIPVDIFEGITEEKAGEISNIFGFRKENTEKLTQLLIKLWKVFVKNDAVQVEINPLVETKSNKITCLDCKINIDNNAKFRHYELFNKLDFSGADKLELEASKYDLNYVGLNGNIGCIVNGAGLAMATMDLIQVLGGDPANFLDIGGAVTTKQVTEALGILTSHPKVNVIFVNVFGGIVSCKIVAHGIVNAAEQNILEVPIVARLEGTQIEEAKQILKDCEIDITYADSMEQAARIAVKIAKNERCRADVSEE